MVGIIMSELGGEGWIMYEAKFRSDWNRIGQSSAEVPGETRLDARNDLQGPPGQGRENDVESGLDI